MIGLLLLAALCVGLCVLALTRAAGVRRVRTAQRLAEIDVYGFSKEGGVSHSGVPLDRATPGIAGVIERIGDLLSSRVGTVREEDMRTQLLAAGMYRTSPRVLLGYRAVCAIMLPALVLVIGSVSAVTLVLAALVGVLGWMTPLVLVRRRARFRLVEIDRGLPDLIDILVVTVEAGLGFTSSLRLAAGEFVGPLSDELRLTLQEQTMGLSVSEALGNLVRRCDTPAMRAFVRAVVQGENLGVSTGVIMRNLAVDMRSRRRKTAEELAQKAPVKMLFPLIFLIFPSLFIVLLTPAVFALADVFR
jgi:tight adherence protein C